jgi:hypothetical protein
MTTFDLLPVHKNMSADDRRAFDRWITAIALVGLILGAGLVAVALVGPTSMRAGHAVTQSTKAPEFSAPETRAERSGVLLKYQIAF